ncbi:MAG: hypothetical protein WC091_04675 [Sulfuricellaceae bacterium]|jgi:hypothetical protein
MASVSECEYFDLKKTANFQASMARMQAVFPRRHSSQPERVPNEYTARANREIFQHSDFDVISEEERRFIFGENGVDDSGNPTKLTDIPSYREMTERIASARRILQDARVENTTFVELPEDADRDPYLVTREEFVFLFGEEPTPDMAASL